MCHAIKVDLPCYKKWICHVIEHVVLKFAMTNKKHFPKHMDMAKLALYTMANVIEKLLVSRQLNISW